MRGHLLGTLRAVMMGMMGVGEEDYFLGFVHLE